MTDNVRPVRAIKVGRRIRQDMGDIDALARDIDALGLLHPIPIRPDNTLVAGARRLKAVIKLRWETVPVRVVHGFEDELRALQAEQSENRQRKDFTPSEAVALGKRLEELERPAAKERKDTAGPSEGKGRKKTGGGKFPSPVADKGKTNDKVGAAVGLSGKSYEKAKAVAEAAAKEPEKFGDLKKQMDQSGKIDSAFKELKRRQKESANPSANGHPSAPPEPEAAYDQLGIRLEGPAAEAFASLPLFMELKADIKRIKKAVNVLAQQPGGTFLARWLDSLVEGGKQRFAYGALDSLLHLLKVYAPHAAACPYCLVDRGVRSHPDCKTCYGAGFVPAATFDSNRLTPEHLTAVQELAETQPKGDAWEGDD